MEIWGIPEKKRRGRNPRLEASQRGSGTVHVLLENKWVAKEKAGGIFVSRADNSVSFRGMWIQTSSTLGFLYHTSNVWYVTKGWGGGGREKRERETLFPELAF